MRVLVACEFSGIVREAFRTRGHDAWSCDLLPAADDSPFHLQADVNFVLHYPDRVLGGRPLWMRQVEWDLLIAHPPCTYLCNSGVRWLYKQGTRERVEARWDALTEAAAFFRLLWEAEIPKIAIENPIMHKHGRELTRCGSPAQIIQPWQFGHGETKQTCLWLENLPGLNPTKIVEGRKGRVHHEPPHPDRWKRRSVTYQGIADAMAEQWG